jgi:hypothetical protein
MHQGIRQKRKAVTFPRKNGLSGYKFLVIRRTSTPIHVVSHRNKYCDDKGLSNPVDFFPGGFLSIVRIATNVLQKLQLRTYNRHKKTNNDIFPQV